jgi:hypothetical protein
MTSLAADRCGGAGLKEKGKKKLYRCAREADGPAREGLLDISCPC